MAHMMLLNEKCASLNSQHNRFQLIGNTQWAVIAYLWFISFIINQLLNNSALPIAYIVVYCNQTLDFCRLNKNRQQFFFVINKSTVRTSGIFFLT